MASCPHGVALMARLSPDRLSGRDPARANRFSVLRKTVHYGSLIAGPLRGSWPPILSEGSRIKGRVFDSSATSNAVLRWMPSDWVGGVPTGSVFLRCDASRPTPPLPGEVGPLSFSSTSQTCPVCPANFSSVFEIHKGLLPFQGPNLPSPPPPKLARGPDKQSWPDLASPGGLAPAPQMSFLSFLLTSPHKHAILPNSKFFQIYYTQPSALLTAQSWPKPIFLAFPL